MVILELSWVHPAKMKRTIFPFTYCLLSTVFPLYVHPIHRLKGTLAADLHLELMYWTSYQICLLVSWWIRWSILCRCMDLWVFETQKIDRRAWNIHIRASYLLVRRCGGYLWSRRGARQSSIKLVSWSLSPLHRLLGKLTLKSLNIISTKPHDASQQRLWYSRASTKIQVGSVSAP